MTLVLPGRCYLKPQETPCVLLPAESRSLWVCKPTQVEYSTACGSAGQPWDGGHAWPWPCGAPVMLKRCRQCGRGELNRIPCLRRAQQRGEALRFMNCQRTPTLGHPSPFWTPVFNLRGAWGPETPVPLLDQSPLFSPSSAPPASQGGSPHLGCPRGPPENCTLTGWS